MSLPANADRIVIRGRWQDEVLGGGVPDATVAFEPVPLVSSTRTPNLRDLTAYGHIKTRSVSATVNPTTGYYAAIVLANNDPDLDAYLGRRVTFTGEDPFTIQVPYNAPSVTVDAEMAAAIPSLTVGQSVKAIWLVEAALVDGTPPPPLAAYLTATQTGSAIATAIGNVRQVPAGGTSGQVVTKNSDATYGWATPSGGSGGAPSGGAGGVLGGSYPNPSFAVDMATQAELDAVRQVPAGGTSGQVLSKNSDGSYSWAAPPSGDAASQTALNAKVTRLNEGLTSWVYGQLFRLVSATRDANSAITSASVVWPDGSTGTFTTTTASSAFPGAIDAYNVTYVPSSGSTVTVTQPAVTRDANGAVSAQPALTFA